MRFLYAHFSNLHIKCDFYYNKKYANCFLDLSGYTCCDDLKDQVQVNNIKKNTNCISKCMHRQVLFKNVTSYACHMTFQKTYLYLKVNPAQGEVKPKVGTSALLLNNIDDDSK